MDIIFQENKAIDLPLKAYKNDWLIFYRFLHLTWNPLTPMPTATSRSSSSCPLAATPCRLWRHSNRKRKKRDPNPSPPCHWVRVRAQRLSEPSWMRLTRGAGFCWWTVTLPQPGNVFSYVIYILRLWRALREKVIVRGVLSS
jgi:hypothetical protein